MFDPKNIDDTLKAINLEARLNEETSVYEAPSVAFALGGLLKLVGNILINECIKRHEEDKRKCAKDYVKLLTQEVNISVNRNVTESQVQSQRQKKIELPSTGDIKKLHDYLTKFEQRGAIDLSKICNQHSQLKIGWI